MKITRALLLSSKKQAISYEPKSGLFLPPAYRYLIADDGEGLRFLIFRMVTEQYVDERKQERERRRPADTAHVDETFKDAGELINFLRRHQIDFEDNWQPVEDN